METRNTGIKKAALVIAAILFLTTLIGYVARVNISVALPFIATDYGWSPEQVGDLGGILLGIFLVGYGISNIFFSPLIDHFGPKKGLMVCVFTWSVFTFFTGLLGAFYSMIVLSRLALGLSQGILFPSASKVTQAWFPKEKRGRVNALYLSSGFASNILVPVLLIPLILITSWEVMFYVVALVGFLLMIPLWSFLKDSPERDSESPQEREKLGTIFRQAIVNLKTSLSIKGLPLLTVAFWATNIVWWGLSLWLPTYLEDGRGLPIDELVWVLSIPYVAGIVGMFSGSWLSDRLGKRALVSAVFAVMASISVIFLYYVEGEIGIMLALSSLWFFMGAIPPNVYTILQGIVKPELMGSATGVMNGLSNGLGVLGPLLIGFVVAQTGSYFLGLVIMSISLLIAAGTILPFREWDKNPEGYSQENV